MTDVTTSQGQESAALSAADEQVLRELTERARAGGLKLTGEGGLLGKLTKMVVEGALEGELDSRPSTASGSPRCAPANHRPTPSPAVALRAPPFPATISTPHQRLHSMRHGSPERIRHADTPVHHLARTGC